MNPASVPLYPAAVPPPGFRTTAWLLAPRRSIGAEGDAELRQSLIRRLKAIIVSAFLTLTFTALAAHAHPSWPFLTWLFLDIALLSVRVPLVVHLVRCTSRGRHGRGIAPWAIDAFVCVGTLWSGLVGFGAMLCLTSGDPGLSIVGGLVAMGTVGAQCARNPGAPRLNTLQMLLVAGPVWIGVLTTPIPLANYAVFLLPLYLLGMLNITRELHADYINLIVARIDNRRRALHCPLTDLPNRNSFNDRMARALDEAGAPAIVVMYLDLDGFKAVNDIHGHPMGDLLLTQVALRLRECAPPDALVSRLGGDEFALLMDAADAATAEETAGAIIVALGRPFDLGEACTIGISVSIGIVRGRVAATPHDLVQRADAALYRAKRAGRGVFRWDGEDVPDHGATITQLYIAAAIRRTDAPARAAAPA